MEPAHSPNTAPMAANVAAMRIPEKNDGRAEGELDPPEDGQPGRVEGLHHPDELGSTDRRPSTPFTTIGKKQISAMITSLGLML